MEGRCLFAEDVIVALLHKTDQLQPGIRLRHDSELTKLICKAAEGQPEPLNQLRLHPQYQDCQRLNEIFLTLSMGGSIRRELGRPVIWPTPHTKGAYGKSIYDRLTPELRATVDSLAERVVAASAVTA